MSISELLGKSYQSIWNLAGYRLFSTISWAIIQKFNLFLFLPKLSQTFLYLEAEKATDQKFGSKCRLSTLKIE